MGLARLRRWSGRLKREVHALYLAYRDPRVPLYAKVLAAVVVAYAFSPLDLIPDPIPILGYLDDLILLPLGVAMAIRLIPAEVMEECRRAAGETRERPVSQAAAVAVVAVWVCVAGAGLWAAWTWAR